MLDIEFIRANRQRVEEDAQAKGVSINVDKIFSADEQRRSMITEYDEKRRQINEHAAQFKQSRGTTSQENVDKGRALKQELSDIKLKLAQSETALGKLILDVPNVMHESVPRGDGETANQVIKTVGQKPDFDFEPKDHETLGQQLDIIDIETGAFSSGSRFYYLKNSAVLLEFALVNWLLEKYTAKGFVPVTTPVLVREHMLEATGFFPADRNEIYQVNPGEDDLYLIGTSEVTLAGLHMQHPLKEDALPRRYVGFSTCFRREAGSYGQDVKGIFRVHQFDKVEMYSFAHPDKSWEEHEYLLSVEEEILGELGFHYQVVNIGSGDLGAPAAKKYDCEVWLPSQQRFRELTSCSNTTDFQSRRGGIKYRNQQGKLDYAHTLNGTAMASTRTLIAVLENYQTKNGRVRVPDVLKKYLGGREYL